MNARVYIPNVLNKKQFTGIELGVARGEFSKQLLETYPEMYLFSVDAWAGDRNHIESEYIETTKTLLPFKERNSIIRTFFENAVLIFPDNYFDFIYVDGYAHTGQDNGQTLNEWFCKVKPGGVMAGHDYDKHFPETIKQVDRFCQVNNLKLHIVNEMPFASWYIIKAK